MRLRILIIHELRVARKITHGYILAEISNAIVDVIASSAEAVAALDTDKYDVVLSGLEMSDMDGLALRDYMKASKLNRDTALIIMTAPSDKIKSERLRSRGVKYILPIPFTPIQLSNIIGEAVDFRSQRAHPRYGVPNTKAILHFDTGDILADVVNISVSGVLCAFTFPVQPVDLAHSCGVSILCPADYDSAATGRIASRMLRLFVESWNHEGRSGEVRGAWEFMNLSGRDREILENIVEKAGNEMAYSEG